MRAMIGEALGETSVVVAFGPPSSATAPSAEPIVDLWLFDIREDLTAREADWFPVRDDAGVVGSWLGPLRRYRLTYLVTVAGASDWDELEILGALVRSLGAVDGLPASCRRGWLAEQTEAIRVAVANPEYSMAEGWGVWSTLGVPARSSVSLAVNLPVRAESTQPATMVQSRHISIQSQPAEPVVAEVVSELIEPGRRDQVLARRRVQTETSAG